MAAAAAPSAETAGGWRLTVDGWEQTSDWYIPVGQPHRSPTLRWLHPAWLAVLQFGLAIFFLRNFAACGRSNIRAATTDPILRFLVS